jgi:hypothetical protein
MNELKPKPEEQNPWGEYFKNEFKMLKLRRGILQADKLTVDELTLLIGEMVLECKVPPYNEIDKVILQRVISDGVLNDPDFIGFTVSWVRRTLNKWWYLSGYKLHEKIIRDRETESEQARSKQVVDNPHLDVDAMLEGYKRSLLLGAAKMKEVPKMKKEEIKKEGAEWTSGIERKATKYSNGISEAEYQAKLKIQRAASEFYKDKASFKLKPFEVGGMELMAESEKDAIEIYNLATKKYEKD